MSNFFSERLKSLRGARKPAEFARFLGIPAPMYHRYENGQIPKENNLRVIAEKCGVTVDSLLSNKAVMNESGDASYWMMRVDELEAKLEMVSKALELILQGTETLRKAVK
jgi:Helix-turn-helix.